MGFLGSKTSETVLKQLPTGSFTVDSGGEIITSTVPTSFPPAQLKEIAEGVLRCFRDGHKVGQNFGELVVQYATFKLTARELRGGAIVFMSPHKAS